jgi:Flp pilus assembly protein TadB
MKFLLAFAAFVCLIWALSAVFCGSIGWAIAALLTGVVLAQWSMRIGDREEEQEREEAERGYPRKDEN